MKGALTAGGDPPAGQLLTEKHLAALLQISVSKIQKDRVRGGKGMIPYVLVGRCVRYRLSDLQRYLEQNLRQHTSATELDKT